MSTNIDTQRKEQLKKARESFSGRLLTDNQFKEAIAITHIMEREIQKNGAFKDKLGDYAHAFSRTEKFDALKAEHTVRDLFKERTGQTMNQMRENLMQRESALFNDSPENKKSPTLLTEKLRDHAYQSATAIGDMVQNGDKMTFYRAYSHQATKLAKDLNITESGAKRFMNHQFEESENQSLYDWGKELEETYYRPQIEAEKQLREETQSRQPNQSRKRA